MPATERALRATNVYREKLTWLRDHAEGSIRHTWPMVSLDDLDATHAAWAARIAAALEEMQRAGARLSAGYLAAYMTAELAKPTGPVGLSASAPIGVSRAGKPLNEALATSLFTVKAAIRDGHVPQEALRAGLERAARNAPEDVLYIARSALDNGLTAETRIAGWRRVTGGGCGACLAAATGAIQHTSAVLPVHTGCKCTKEPVLAGIKEHYQRPTGREVFDAMPGDQQDKLLGPEKAQLVRDGSVPFHQLVERQPMAAIPDGITERPLEALIH